MPLPKARVFLSGVLLLLLIVALPVAAQEGRSVSISVPETEEDLYQDLADQFMEQNPDITVSVLSYPFDFTADSPADIEEELDSLLETFTESDVILGDNSIFTEEAIRAGYLLDMTPLVQADPNLNVEDFYETIWDAYHWDGGIWAMPYAATVVSFFYDPQLFDIVGLPYPDASWTLDDVENALRTLRDARDDEIIEADPFQNFFGNGASLFILSLLDDNLVDEMTLPAEPDLSNPRLEELLTQWVEMTADNLFATTGQPDTAMILGPSAIAGIPQFTEGMEITLIPGGTPVISVDGLAISAGTQNPEAAYEFIKFLTESPELLENAFGSIPARRSLADVDISDDQAVFGIEELSPEAEAVVQEALALALNPADFRFSELIADAADVMVAESIDASTALEQVEQETLQDLAAADARRGVDEVIVVGPTPVPELAPGQNSIRFAISSFISPLPTQDVWEQTIADFVADNPDVGNVTLEVEQNFGNVEPEDLAAQFDCFYLPNNVVRSIDLDTILALDPLLSTDPNFNRDDLVGQVFAEVQRENQTWALPLTLQPEVLFYNRDIFVENGVPLPEGGWTVPQFEEALRSIKVTQDDPSPFVPQNLGNSYLLVLIASYGGLPVDYRTTPVTLDFTSPEVVDAAREVLDLAKAGYIAYEPSVEGGLQFFGGGGDDDPVAIYNQLLNPLISLIGGGGDENEANQLVTFPQGNQLNAVSYDLGAAYISATTDNVETCYRFISTIATTPGLFTDMPAFRSQIDAPETVQEQGEDAVAFYRAMDELLQQPSTVLIPTPITGALENTGNAIAQLWLNRAFDRYVLGDADLEAELQEAQQFANEFLDCIGGVEPADIGGEEFNAFIQEVLDCIGDVDPTLRDQLGI